MKFKSALALIGCSLAVSLQSDAAVVVSLSSSAPTSGIVAYNAITTGTPANITSYWREPGGSDLKKDIGQGFSTAGLTSSYSMTAVTFNIFSFSAAVQGLQYSISIYESTSLGAPSPATLVSKQLGTLPTLVTNDYITFNLDHAVTLSPDKIYNVMFSFEEKTSNSSTVNSLSLKTIGTGMANTSGGRRWINIDGTYTNASSNGFVFYAHATAIPEPGSVILLGVGTLALARALKRRHAL